MASHQQQTVPAGMNILNLENKTRQVIIFFRLLILIVTINVFY